VKKDEKKLTFAALTQLAPADLYAEAKLTVKLNKAIGTAREKFTDTLQYSAKIVAAMKRRYTEMVNTKAIPADTTFKKYFESNAGGLCPGRVEALASLFNALVETKLVTEEIFDGAAVDWLEKSNAIVSHARKTHGDAWKGSDDVLDVVNALSKPGDARAKLKAIRERQKAAENPAVETGEGNAPKESAPLTLGVAVEFIKALFAAASDAEKDRQVELCAALFGMNDAWANNDLSENRRNELDKQAGDAMEAGIDPTIKIEREETAAAAN
jgi:hypothetical protein